MKSLPGIDFGWVACDETGYVGVFFTGGEGPVPDASFLEGAMHETLFDELASLPRTTASELLVRFPRPEDYVASAERGLFAFDWSDAHRTGNALNGYEMIARPAMPLTLSQLPQSLRAIVASSKLIGARFLEMSVIKLPIE